MGTSGLCGCKRIIVPRDIVWEERLMLKAYAVSDLRPGMTIGKDVIGNDASVLIQAGTTLDNAMIAMLNAQAVYSVEVWSKDEVEEETAAPPAPAPPAEAPPSVHHVEKDVLLDDSYIGVYNETYKALEKMLIDLRDKDTFDMADLDGIFQKKTFYTLCDGAKAVSQSHNMSRKGKYVVHHNLGVAILAGLMARWLRMDATSRRDLITAALFLDAGKLRISDAVLNKRARLTPTEYGIVMNHPKFSYEMLLKTPLSGNQNVIYGVLQHHERCDGSGYPYHIPAAQISAFGKILGILDVYDAMAADRAYAKRSSPFDIFTIINDDILAGRFDTQYGVLFIRQVCHALNGNWVRLSSGDSGRIVYLDESRIASLPVVETTKGEFLDLNQKKDVRIEWILTAEEVEKLKL